MDAMEYSILDMRVGHAIEQFISSLTSNSYSMRESVQANTIILNELLVRPEFIQYNYLNSIKSVLQSISKMPDNVIFALPDDFHKAYFEIVSAFFVRVQYELNVDLKTENFTQFYTISSSYSQRIASLQSFSKQVWTSAEQYLIRISSKVESSNPALEYSTTTGAFKIEHKIANSVKGNTYTIHSGMNYQITFPPDLFDGTIVTDLGSDIKTISIVWLVNPISLHPADTYRAVSDTLSIILVDEYRQAVSISGKSISIILTSTQATPTS
jgi:hypothetical protein